MKRAIFFLILLVISKGALAAVTCTVGAGPFTFPIPSTVTLSSAPVVGTRITNWYSAGSPSTYLTCNSIQISWGANGNLSATGQSYTEGGITYPVFATNLQGIGVVIQGNGKGKVPLTTTYQTVDGNYNTNGLGTSLSAALVATGQIVSGTVVGTLAATSYLEGGGTTQYPVGYYLPSITITRQYPTCSVSTPSVSVPMGSIPAKSFTGIGSTPSGVSAVSFNLALNCSGGIGGAASKIYVTLTDATNPANRTNTLSLTSDSVASGIGIQMRSGTNIISYGPDSNVAGNTNQWLSGSAGNGIFNIPLSAQYIQTSTTIKGGTANGRATFTMSYQ